MKKPSAPSTSFSNTKSHTHSSDAVADRVAQILLPVPTGWPILDHRALPGVLRDIVQASCSDTEADPVAVLASVLVWFGASIGPEPHVMVGHSRHCARLQFVKVGETARARKGTSEDPVKRVFRAAEALASGEAGFLPLKECPGPLSTGEGLIQAVRDAGDELNEAGSPIDPGVSDKRLLVIEEELAAPLHAAQRHGNILSAVLRTVWDSGTIAPLTKMNRIKVTGAHVCIVGHITIFELMKLLQKTDIWNGFANRMLWLCVRRPKQVPDPLGFDDNTLMELAQRVRRIIDRARTVNRVLWSTEARADWCALYPYVSVDEDGVFGAVTARAEAQMQRLTLIYALIDESAVILPRHLMAAAALWDYARASARYIFQDCSEDRTQTRILSLLREGSLSSTEINKAFGGHVPSSQLSQTLEILQGSGQINSTQQETNGRSATQWSLVAPNAIEGALSVAGPVESNSASFAKSASSANCEGESLVDRLQRLSDERSSEQLRSIGLR
jgi:hypothetical protein